MAESNDQADPLSVVNASGGGAPVSHDVNRYAYEETTGAEYGERAASAFSIVNSHAGIELVGRCPRCEDEMAYPYWNRVYKRIVGGTRRLKAEGTLEMICTCREFHRGRPKGVSEGCGAYWNVLVEVTD